MGISQIASWLQAKNVENVQRRGLKFTKENLKKNEMIATTTSFSSPLLLPNCLCLHLLRFKFNPLEYLNPSL